MDNGSLYQQNDRTARQYQRSSAWHVRNSSSLMGLAKSTRRVLLETLANRKIWSRDFNSRKAWRWDRTLLIYKTVEGVLYTKCENHNRQSTRP